MKYSYRFFLGGHDLEMHTIRELLMEAGLGGAIADHGLAWGAKASAYASDIRASLARGETPVLIELADDLGACFERNRILFVDHHAERAGSDAPSALRQIFDLIAAGRKPIWTRWFALVEANDIGHAEALRRLGASPAEIRAVRDADRRAQGVGTQIEAESRRAIAGMQRRGALAIVGTTASTSSAIADFLLPEYDGPGPGNLIVLMPDKIAFFGDGCVVRALADVPACWYGGALPERGYWGAPRASVAAVEPLIDRIAALLNNQ